MVDRRLGEVTRDAQGHVKVFNPFAPDQVLGLVEKTPPNGSWVEVELVDKTTARMVGDVLAEPNSAHAKLYALLVAHQIDPLFKASVIDEAQKLVKNPGFDAPDLEDLTHLSFITIDNDNSRDLDQAMYLARSDSGGFHVYYALSDASYYVKEGTALWAQALRRGASFYLPSMSAPMLPRVLSEGLVSLNADQLRRALIFRAELSADAEVLHTQFSRALVKSHAKLTYKGVQRFHDGTNDALAGQSYTDTLQLLKTIGKRLIVQAEARNMVRFDRKSAWLGISDDGKNFVAREERRNDVERWNEQISLLCNMQGSRLVSGAEHEHVQPVFKVHEAPSMHQLEQLRERIDALIAVQELEVETWRWPGPRKEVLASYLERLPRRSDTTRLRAAIERLAMLSGSASLFSTDKGGHYGLAAEEYGRFSSPMREIVGIFTHKEVVEMLTGPQPHHNNARDIELRNKVIEAGNRARSLQRRLTRESYKLVLDQWFAEDLEVPEETRRTYDGTVLGVRTSRLYVQMDDPPLELKVYTSHLTDVDGAAPVADKDRVSLTRATGETVRLGDPITLQVAGYDDQASRWFFRILGSVKNHDGT